MVLDMADDTRVSFRFTLDAVNDLARGVNKLLVAFKSLQKEKTKQDLLEYKHESDNLRVTVDCNPNIFPNAFSATAYVVVDNGTVRVSSSAQLTKLVDNIKAFKSAISESK